MTKTLVVGTVCLGLMCVASAAHAQEMERGTWSGAITPPGGEPVPVTFTVAEAEGALAIVMSNPNLGEIVFNDEQVEGDELTFWWEPGVRVDCTLQRRADRGFEGVCSDANGSGSGAMEMIPPAQ